MTSKHGRYATLLVFGGSCVEPQADVAKDHLRTTASSLLESDKIRGEDTRLMFVRLRYGDRLCSTTVARRFPAICICHKSQPPGSKCPEK